jgi:Zn-finger nucleic acid-binding protein
MYTYCPRDNFALTTKNLHGADVFQCAHCHGVWIPKASILSFNKEKQLPFLEEYLEQSGLPEHFKQGALLCPTDGAKMLFTLLNDFEVDICPTCHGVWLDKGEMESLPAAQVSQPQNSPSLAFNALDVLVHLPPVDSETISAGVEMAGEATGAVLEVAAEAASGAGEILGNLLGAIAEALFSG